MRFGFAAGRREPKHGIGSPHNEVDRGCLIGNTDPLAFFVYGTLKKSQLRGGLWPREPSQIRSAIIQADLFDLGPYPAAVHGSGWILGEIWHFEPRNMEATLQALDQIEGYDAHDPHNEYVREIVVAEWVNGDEVTTCNAFAYLNAQAKRLEMARPIMPFLKVFGRTAAAWPDSSARVPASFSDE